MKQIVEFKTKKEANNYIGGLSNTSKMPSKSYGLPAAECNVGSKLRKVCGSVCSNCYAFQRGMYRFDNVTSAQYRRLETITSPLWVAAMVKAIGSDQYFRWHDSGDLMSMAHLLAIVEVCKSTPKTNHWLPTKEKALIKRYLKEYGRFPENLVVRVSAAMVNGKPVSIDGANSSTVHDGSDYHGSECKAYRTQKNGQIVAINEWRNMSASERKSIDTGYCGDCRACWNHNVDNVSYPQH